MGLPLYLKHGWKKVDEIVINLTEYGGDEDLTEMCMIREPGAGC